MNVFDALLRSEPRLTRATLDAFLRYAEEVTEKAAQGREVRGGPVGSVAERGWLARGKTPPRGRPDRAA